MGLSREADRLFIRPCLPKTWPGCSITYRYGEARYQITMQQFNAADDNRITLDGVAVGLDDEGVLLVDDQCEHKIDVIIYNSSHLM